MFQFQSFWRAIWLVFPLSNVSGYCNVHVCCCFDCKGKASIYMDNKTAKRNHAVCASHTTRLRCINDKVTLKIQPTGFVNEPW